MKPIQGILISIIIFVLSSCNALSNLVESSTVPTPNIGIDVQSGKYLEITAPKGWNSFKTDDLISLEIRNISKNQIIADPDFGARIFVLTDGEWIEVENKIVYKNDPFTLDPTENYDPMKTASTGVRPELLDYSIRSEVRIFIVGTLIENGKESKKVASYIDLTLNP
jgi:hypothetical protein